MMGFFICMAFLIETFPAKLLRIHACMCVINYCSIFCVSSFYEITQENLHNKESRLLFLCMNVWMEFRTDSFCVWQRLAIKIAIFSHRAHPTTTKTQSLDFHAISIKNKFSRAGPGWAQPAYKLYTNVRTYLRCAYLKHASKWVESIVSFATVWLRKIERN